MGTLSQALQTPSESESPESQSGGGAGQDKPKAAFMEDTPVPAIVDQPLAPEVATILIAL